jgi:hypothetical protein
MFVKRDLLADGVGEDGIGGIGASSIRSGQVMA